MRRLVLIFSVLFCALLLQAQNISVIEYTVGNVQFAMIRVDGGTFLMGATKEQKKPSRDENPVHQVTLSSYYIGETEVTQELWQAVMGSNPSKFKFKGSQRPVERVSWNNCQEFIGRLNQITGQQFRLPTEAEWEYAARGGNKSEGYQYSGSNKLSDVAWFSRHQTGNGSHDVKTKKPNELGVYDMSGNVWEWCQDRYGHYTTDSQMDPVGAISGPCRVYRGGSWFDFDTGCRVARRGYFKPDSRDFYLGLRLAHSDISEK